MELCGLDISCVVKAFNFKTKGTDQGGSKQITDGQNCFSGKGDWEQLLQHLQGKYVYPSNQIA